jgi:hypothetical protein
VGAGSNIVDPGTIIDARHVAILAATGVSQIAVRRRIEVGIFSTGNELVAPGRPLAANQIHDSNGLCSRRAGGQLSGSTAAGGARAAAVFANGTGRTEFMPVRAAGAGRGGVPLLEKLGRGGSALAAHPRRRTCQHSG